MKPLLYDELVPWYRLLDPAIDHEDEATCYADALERYAPARPTTVLELGSGAGNNAMYFKSRFRCTLSDLSPAMLGLSRELNPECEHLQGDMRSLRLGRQFDAVFIHDAIAYMTTREDLRAALATAFLHTRPGGSVLLVPDHFKDGFVEQSALHEGQSEERALRCLEWAWDPDPSDERFRIEYAFLLREGAELRSVHDRHDEGLFSRDTWLGLLADVGYEPRLVPRPLDDGCVPQMLFGLRPGP